MDHHPKRIIPFPLIFFAIVGSFVLAVLYFDVRGREKQAQPNESEAPVSQEEAPASEPEKQIEDGSEKEQEADLLTLTPKTPSSDISAVAVHDCWRYEFRGDRIIVDHDYIDVSGGDLVPLVTEETLHLFCQEHQIAIRSGDKTLFFVPNIEAITNNQKESVPSGLTSGMLYEINSSTGEFFVLSDLSEAISPDATYFINGVSNDGQFLYIQRAPDETKSAGHLIRVGLDSGQWEEYKYEQVWPALTTTPDDSRAIGVEWEAENYPDFPAYLHRINLDNHQRIRVGSILDWKHSASPIFIDEERIVMQGEENPLFIMNIYTKNTSRVPEISTEIDRLSITTDRSAIVFTGPDVPLTVLPVSELPKP